MKITAIFVGQPSLLISTKRFSYENPELNNLPLEAIAEEVFDFSNNPSRYEASSKVFGPTTRSLSSGDIVVAEHNGKTLAQRCLGMGWEVITEDLETFIKKMENASYLDRAFLNAS